LGLRLGPAREQQQVEGSGTAVVTSTSSRSRSDCEKVNDKVHLHAFPAGGAIEAIGASCNRE